MFKNIPNFLTLTSLFLGSIAAYLAARDQIEPALWFVAACLVLDWLDGFTARLLRAGSAIGRQLDSLADVVAFGVVPSFFLAHLIGQTQFAEISDKPGVFIVAAFAGLRLAIYNTSEPSDDFTGLPVPAAAIFCVSLPFWESNLIYSPSVIYGCAVGISLMMIAPVRMLSLKFKSAGLGKNLFRYLLIASSLVWLLVSGRAAGIWIIITYIILSLLSGLWQKNTGQKSS